MPTERDDRLRYPATTRASEGRPRRYRAAAAERARLRLSSEECTTGFVVVGIGRTYVRFVVEHASTFGLFDQYARLFRDYPPGSPDWLSDAARGRGAAERQRDLFQESFLIGEGLEFRVAPLDDPGFPYVVDWVTYAANRRSRLGRDPLFLRRNVPLLRRGTSGVPAGPVASARQR